MIGRKLLMVSVALIAVTAIAVPASALSWGGYSGDILIKLGNFDTGVLYPLATPLTTGAGVDLIPGQIAAPGADPGEDAWGIFNVTQIYAGTDTSAPLLYTNSVGSPVISGIFWGAVDTYVAPGSSGVSQFIHSVGLQVAFFEQPYVVLDPSNAGGGPASRTAGPAPTYSNYTGTPAQLLWTMNSVPGYNPTFPTDEFFTEFSPSGALLGGLAAGGGFLAEMGTNGWGTGIGNGMIYDQPGADVRVQFTGVLDTTYGFLINSNDPAAAIAVPLPSSVYMGFVGLVALGFGAYRRQRAA